MVKGGFTEQVRTEQRLKGGEGIDHADTCRQKKNQHQAYTCYAWGKKACVTGVEWTREKVVGDEFRGVMGSQTVLDL